MRVIIFLLVILSAPAVLAQEHFDLPSDLKGIPPIGYLENLSVKDPSRQLSETEKHELCRLFAKAFLVSIRGGGGDSLLETSTPIYRLLAANFPDVKTRTREGGSLIFLAAITKFFNSLPAYRSDVLGVLRQGVSQKHCREPSEQ